MSEISRTYEDPGTVERTEDVSGIPVDSKSSGTNMDKRIGVLDRRTEYKWLIASFFAMFLCGKQCMLNLDHDFDTDSGGDHTRLE